MRPGPCDGCVHQGTHPTPQRAWDTGIESPVADQTHLPGAAVPGALEQALKYGLFDLTRLENLVLSHVAGDFFALDESSRDNHPNEQDDKGDEQTKDDSDPA